MKYLLLNFFSGILLNTRLLLALLMFLMISESRGQISLTNALPSNTQNFDGMGGGLILPTNWRIHQSASTTWAGGTGTLGQQASSGSPTAGASYNWGTTAGTDRAAGVMTSGGYPSPNSLIGFYTNGGSSNILSLSITYDAERYRVNSAAASVQFFYSADGSSWTAIPAGDIASSSFPAGASTYTFTSPLTINLSSISINSLSITPSSNFYLRWNLNTTGTNSQGIGIDNVIVTATFASSCTAPSTQASSISTSSPATDGFNVAWTAGTGDGTMIVVKPAASATALPANGTIYTPNLAWASAAQIDANNRVVFRAAGTSAGPVTGLTAGTQYTFTAYEYSNTGNCYNFSAAPSVNRYTLANEPAAHAASFTCTSVSSSQINLSFPAANTITNGSGYLLLYKANSGILSASPSDAMFYTPGSNLGDAVVATYIGNTATSYSVTGLSASTTYYFQLIPYGSVLSIAETLNYRTAATIPSTNCTTSAAVAFTYVAGDYRPSVAGTTFSTNGQWESYNGSAWTGGQTAPQNLAPASRPPRIIIDKTGIGGSGSASNTYNDVIIISGGELYLVDNDAPPVAAEFLNASKRIEVLSGGRLFVQGDIDLPATASMIVRSGGSVTIDQNTVNNTHPIWDGIENFESGSTFEVLNWGFTGTGAGSLMNIYSTITDNALGYKFGVLTANINPAFSWVLVGGSLTVNLCETLNISNASANPVSITSNNLNPNVTIGTINHYSGLLGLTGSFSGAASQTVSITGNLNSSGGTLRLYYSGGGTASSIDVNLAGNLTISSGVSVSNDGGAGARLNFTGTGTQYVDVTPNINAWPIYVKANAYVAQSRSLSLATGSSLNIDLSGTFDNNGEYQITSGGGLPSITINGRFITRDVQGFSGTNAAIPGILPTLNAGCTVEYGLSGAIQAVTTRTDYRNVTFSGSGNKTISSAFNPNGTVYITGAAVVQQGNNSFGDATTSLTMDGGRLVMTGARTLPDMTGTYILTAGVVEFAGASNQTIRGTATYSYQNIEVTGIGVANSSGNINLRNGGTFTVKGTGIFTMNDNSIVGPSGAQTLTIETGGKFVCNTPLGFFGAAGFPNSPCVRNDIETITLQSNSTIEYSYVSAQNFTPISTAPVTNYKNVIISGGGEKILTGAVTIEEILTLTSGVVSTSNVNLLSLSSAASCPAGGSTTSFINGPMKKIGNTDFIFPVGQLVGPTGHYRTIGIVFAASGSGSTTQEFTTQFRRASANTQGTITSVASGNGLQRVSACEYWDLTKSSGAENVGVALSWASQSQCNVGNYVTDLTKLVVVQYNGTQWGDLFGRSSTTGTASAGTITWTGANTYNKFVLGSTDANQNPLPFEFTRFSAVPRANAIMLEWAVSNNNEQQEYIVERSTDGIFFETLSTIAARLNVAAAEYTHYDLQPYNGWNYYRLRAKDYQNKIQASNIVKVFWNKEKLFTVMPNPASEKIVINLSDPSSIRQIQIVNTNGQILHQLSSIRFLNEVNISSLQAGMYYIRFLGKDGLITWSFVKQ